MIVQLWCWKTSPTMVTPSIADHSPVSTDQQFIYSTTHLLPSSGLHWFPREIDCPNRVAPEPLTIVLWHLIHEFCSLVCTSYTNSSFCTLVYSLRKVVACYSFALFSFVFVVFTTRTSTCGIANGSVSCLLFFLIWAGFTKFETPRDVPDSVFGPLLVLFCPQ